MSDYRNYRINTILIPEIGEDDEPTGVHLTLEVISQEILTKTTQVFEGGMYQQQEIVYVCFLNMPGRPRKLIIVNPSDYEEIIIKGFTNENQKFRNRSTTNRKEGQRSERNNHPGNSIGSQSE